MKVDSPLVRLISGSKAQLDFQSLEVSSSAAQRRFWASSQAARYRVALSVLLFNKLPPRRTESFIQMTQETRIYYDCDEETRDEES